MPVALGPTSITNIRLGNTAVQNIYLGNQRVWAPLPVVTSDSLVHIVNTAFSYQIQATSSPTSYSSTALPTGLSLNTATGVISGIPTVLGSTFVSIFATNPGGTGVGSLTITISPPPPEVTTPVFGEALLGVPYSHIIVYVAYPGGEPNYINANLNFPLLSATPGTLPPGLSVNTSTGEISGTPTTVGSYFLFVSAGNVSGGTWAFGTLTVSDPLGP